MSSVGFSALEKNDVLIGKCCPSNPADSNGHLVHVFFSLKLLVQVWQPPTDYNVCRTSNFKKGIPNDHYCLQRAFTPAQITPQRSGGPKQQ